MCKKIIWKIVKIEPSMNKTVEYGYFSLPPKFEMRVWTQNSNTMEFTNFLKKT
jgi:hypothetical protein